MRDLVRTQECRGTKTLSDNLLAFLWEICVLAQSKKETKNVKQNNFRVITTKLPLLYRHYKKVIFTMDICLWWDAPRLLVTRSPGCIKREVPTKAWLNRIASQNVGRSPILFAFAERFAEACLENFLFYLSYRPCTITNRRKEKDSWKVRYTRERTQTPEFLFCSIRTGQWHTRTNGGRGKEKRGIPELWWAHP